jgi:hypothetical protein
VRTFIALVVAVLALTASGCGGGDEAASGASPEEWSADVCGALESWQSDLETRSNELRDAASGATSVDEGRDLIVDFLDETIARTDQMLNEVEAAGTPAVEDGETIARDFRAQLAKIKPIFEDAREKAAALPDDPQAFAEGAQEIGTAMSTAGDQVGAEFESEKFDSADLDKAFNDEPACQQLKSA